MTTIRLIENPPFDVNFQPYIDAKKTVERSILETVRDVAMRPFELTGFIFIAVAKSSSQTISYSWISFKHNVLGYYGSLSKYKPPQDFYLVLFRVVFWSLGVFWCFAITAGRLLIDQIAPPSKTFLNAYTEGKIDPAHLRTKEQAIDMTNVPADIKVDRLMTCFKEINFTDVDGPGYMSPASRKEGSKTYSTKELEEALATFIGNIKGRVAFLGTPPAYDTPRLMAFYQQIEDAVRFSINKVHQDLESFKVTNGTDPSKYDVAQMKQYKDLLENKARVAIDMAIAGKHCGARYMGESMTTYFGLRGEGEVNGTLEDTLVELLASKRNELAQRKAYQLMGADTHGLSKYMASLGEPLGLPGTRSVVEHLRQSFDYDTALKQFFQDYTVDFIIDAVQEKCKKSQLFREKITDWLKDQVRDWKKDERRVQELAVSVQRIMDEKIEIELPTESKQFQALIAELRSKKIAWPTENAWDDFILEIFSLQVTKEWFKTQFPSAQPMELMQKRNAVKVKFSEEQLGKETALKFKEAILEGRDLPFEASNENEVEQAKIRKIQQLCPSMQKETIARVLKGEVTLVSALTDYLDLDRRTQFLIELHLDNMAKEGLSPALLEWLLVSQQILLPQEV